MSELNSIRIWAIVIDVIFITILQVLFVFIAFLVSGLSFEETALAEYSTDIVLVPILITALIVIPFLGLLYKDHIFGNQSVGKKLMNLQVISTVTNKSPKKDVLWKRNLPLLFIVFIGIGYLYNGKRIGDYYFNTDVVRKV